VGDPTDSRLRALADATLKLARSAPSGRLALARLAAAIDPRWLDDSRDHRLAGELEKAAEEAREPVPMKVIERALRDAWGVAPGRELDALESAPAAVTPLAQVHRGVLDGDAVAVKVLRPGLATGVRGDLLMLDGLARPLAAAFPGVDARAMIDEVRERVLDELDLDHEADAQRRAHRALRDHPCLSVTAPVGRLANHNVLVTPWLDGVPLADTAGRDRDRAAALYVAFVAGGAREGLVKAAATPQDALLLADGRLGVLDFGAVAAGDAGRAAAAAGALRAVRADDAEAWAASLTALAVLPSARHRDARALAADGLGPFAGAGAARLDAEAAVAVGRRLGSHRRELAGLAAAGTVSPGDLWPLRGLGEVLGAVAAVGATADWLGAVSAALQEGWDAARDIERFLA